jgi:hypothetical protein
MPNCPSKFIRRGYLKKHLTLIHKMDKTTAQQSASNVVLQPDKPERKPLTETYQYEAISEDDDGDLDNWLDTVISNPSGTTQETDIKPGVGSEEAVIDDEMSINGMYDEAEFELQRIRETNTGISGNADVTDTYDSDVTVTDDVITLNAVECDEVTACSDAMGTDTSDIASVDSITKDVTDADSHVSNVDDVYSAHSDGDEIPPSTSNDDASVPSDNATDDDTSVFNATDDDATMVNAPDDNIDNNITEEHEYINVTLRTTTRYVNGVYDSVDRVVSLGYSDNFNPDSVDPLTVFRRVQEEFINYVSQHNQ